ncbi:MAG: pyridoxamine 5'-phosphate oxidase family protein, partial [Sphingomonadales bacterium]|nr:pyridoxamine 5'-phosphate oxidase family protein [Sphingomonadales bacterium]
MADFFDALSEKHIAFIAEQPMFFTATAAAEGRINLSPKGYDSFRVLDPARVAFLDLGGSGNETHAHLADNGRITIMFCAFRQPALILRIYGKGAAVLPQDAGWDDLA